MTMPARRDASVMRLRSIMLAVAFGTGPGAGTAWSQTTAASIPSDGVVDASLVVRFAMRKTTYQIGEEIPLELEFRGKAGKDFYFSTQSSDRSGRLSTEQYAITPVGFVDPLADLFGDAELLFGGGPGGLQPLDGTPFILHVSLNDWARFTRPGTYRLVVTSNRLAHKSSPPAPALTSTPIELTIVPSDDRWAAFQLRDVTDLIDGGKEADVKRGITLLRYLDTEDAASAVVDR